MRVTALCLAVSCLLLACDSDDAAGHRQADVDPYDFQVASRPDHFSGQSRAQLTTVTLDRDILKVEPALQSEAWTLGVGTDWLGREAATLPTAVTRVGSTQNRLEIVRTDFEEYFVNSPAGLEQGWRVARRPEGLGPLVVHVKFDGLQLSEVDGEIVLAQNQIHRFRYHTLLAKDAAGKRLPGTMKVLNSWKVVIEVDDSGAQYPIVIDPTLSRIGQSGASDGMAGDEFASSVAVDGDLAAIGAPGDDSGTGAVYVFERVSGVWSEVAKLTADDKAAGARFGEAVDVTGGSVLVGAPGDDTAGVDAGAAYIFRSASGVYNQEAKLVSSIATNGSAGSSVFLMDDGANNPQDPRPIALLGAPDHTNTLNQEGLVVVFSAGAAGWGEQPPVLSPAAVPGGRFGASFAADLSSLTVFIGHPGYDEPAGRADIGAVQMFHVGPDPDLPEDYEWTLLKTVTTTTTATGDEYGASVSYFGGILAVGAPGHGTSGGVFRHLRDQDGPGAFGFDNRIVDAGLAANARFGASLHNAGAVLMVGAPAAGAGSVVFLGQDQGGPGAWGVISRAESPTGQAGDRFGASLSMSGTLAVGAPNEAGTGQAHFFELTGEIIAANDDYTVAADESLVVTTPGVLGNDLDPEGDPLTATIKTLPTGGGITFNANGSFTFLPSGLVGTHSFTYTASDGGSESTPATVRITVTAPNQPPVAVDDVASTPRDNGVSIAVLANDSDPEGDELTLTSVTDPPNGTATIVGDQVSYVPANGFSGQDVFYYVITAKGGTDNGAVFVNVTNANEPPVANADTIPTTEEVPVTFSPLDNDTDPDGDVLTLDSVADPPNGTAVQNGNDVTYTPDANFAGFDVFSYIVRDSAGNLAQGSIRIAVTDLRDPPTAVDDGVMTGKSTPILIDVLANDIDPDSTPTIAQITQPTNGTATIIGDRIEYSPTPLYFGPDSFNYTITDGFSFSSATVSITVLDINLVPRFGPPTPLGTIRREAGSMISFRVFAFDGDPNDVVTYGIQNMPTGATLDPATGQFQWLTNASHSGINRLNFTATDGTDTATTTVTVELSFDDADGDGVSDDWESLNGLDPTTIDTDSDGLTDGDEVGVDLTNVPDTDGDGIIDALDDDSDADGFPDRIEAGDDDLDTPPRDTDGDGVPDFRDTDSDNDGTEDRNDNCPYIENSAQQNLDGDEFGDVCDEDRDGDGILDEVEERLGLDPDTADSDGDSISDSEEVVSTAQPNDADDDGIIDPLDEDSDNDSIPDSEEAGDDDLTTRAVDTDGDGIADFRDTDSDEDTIPDGSDNCRLVPNAAQTDEDGDGIGDRCDFSDLDGDGVADGVDNCPETENANQTDTDEDAAGDACDDDDDNDEIADTDDNCPLIVNEDQRDHDDDGLGDVCDVDDDDDGIPDGADNCPLDANADQADEDGDGEGDACERKDPDDGPGDDGCCRVVAPTRSPTAPMLAAIFALFAIVRTRRRDF